MYLKKITEAKIEVNFEHKTSNEDVYKVNNGATVNMPYNGKEHGAPNGTEDHYASDP